MSAVVYVSPEVWAERHFSTVDLGDRRRTRRAVKLAVGMARMPGGSLPTQAGTCHDAKAGYRLFDGKDVTYEAMIDPHLTRTRDQARRPGVTLMIQDTTELDFSAHRATDDLGPIGNGRGQGFIMHSTLAVDPSGEGDVLGLAHQMLFCRDGVRPKETKAQRKRRPRESQIWCQSAQAVGRPPSNAQWVHVCDRYADFFELFDTCRETGVDLVIRMAQDRRCSPGHEAATSNKLLMQWVRSLPVGGEKTLRLRSRPKRKAREARLSVAFAEVSVFEPKLGRFGASPFRGWAVRVWEDDTPTDEAPIEWVLLTSVPVRNAEDARRITQWYSLRWLIEEYHKCLKSGCRVEDRQLETRDRLAPCIAMLAVVAVRLLELKLAARREPTADAGDCVGDLYVRVLAAYRHRTPAPMTTYEFWREVAKLGGFLGRKGDGEPGWQTLWRGWQQLEAMALGAQLQQQHVNCG